MEWLCGRVSCAEYQMSIAKGKTPGAVGDATGIWNLISTHMTVVKSRSHDALHFTAA